MIGLGKNCLRTGEKEESRHTENELPREPLILPSDKNYRMEPAH